MPPVEYICINHVDICWAYFTIQLNSVQFNSVKFNSIQCSVQFSLALFGSKISSFSVLVCKSTASDHFLTGQTTNKFWIVNIQISISSHFFVRWSELSRASFDASLFIRLFVFWWHQINIKLFFFDEKHNFFHIFFHSSFILVFILLLKSSICIVFHLWINKFDTIYK